MGSTSNSAGGPAGGYNEAPRFRASILIIVLAISAYWYFQKIQKSRADWAYAKRIGCKPAQYVLPYKWPLALDLLKMQYDALPSQKLLAFQSQFLKDDTPTTEFRLFGNTGYVTTDPKNVEAIISTQFKDFGLGSRREGLWHMLGEGIFTQDGPAWAHSREILRRQFARMQYQNLGVFDNHVELLMSRLSAHAEQGGTVDLQPEFFRFTLATTTSLIFGEPVGSLNDDDNEDTFGENFDYASLISARRIRLADLYWLYTPKKFSEACNTVKRYAHHFVKQALKEREERKKNGEEGKASHAFILDLYEELQDEEKVRDQLVHVLLAGRDTTACLMSWTVFLLVRHRPVLERLQREIRAVIGDQERLTRAQISKLPYLKCVLNETLRLYPQIPVNIRFALQTTSLPRGGGKNGDEPLLLPNGCGVAFSVYHMHRRESLYGPDAEEYRPERWETGELDDIGFGYLQFHGGPRICLGKDFALMEASYALVRVLQAFPDIRLAPEIVPDKTGQEKQEVTIVVSSAEGCKVVLG